MTQPQPCACEVHRVGGTYGRWVTRYCALHQAATEMAELLRERAADPLGADVTWRSRVESLLATLEAQS